MAEPMRLQCKNCGGELDTARSAGRVVKCPYCGATYLLPKEETGGKARTLLTLGEQYLYTADFEGAYAAYEKAAGLQADEPEAYFGMALAKAKVQFLYDHVNKRLQPICHALGEGKFSDDKNYKKALALAEREQREEYERRAEEIDEIRLKFRSFEEAGLDYDCFLCVKVTEEDGTRHTEDSFIAAQIFSELKKEGYAPFYSEEEIKGRTGSDYEALILYALYKSECMLLVCSNEDYLQTPWVKNEYARFLRLVNDEEKESDAITFVFCGKPVERIPGRKGKVQGINFQDGTAIKRIEEFVSAHTPEARMRREEEKKRKAEEEELKNRVFTEWLRKQTEESEGKKRAEEEAKRAKEERRVAERKRDEIAAAEAARRAEETRRAEVERMKKERAEREAQEKRRAEEERYKQQEIAAAEAQRKAEEKKWEEEQRIAEEFEIEEGVLVKYKGKGGTVVIPNGVMEIGEKAFNGCTSLISVMIPDGVTRIDHRAFEGCSSLTSIAIPNGVTSIGHDAFFFCHSLTSITIPDSVTEIGSRAFYCCRSLTSITIPDSVTNISYGAFWGCSSLTSITIPDSVTEIGNHAFDGCSSLTSIAIPDSVTKIDRSAFSSCFALTAVYVSDLSAWCRISFENFASNPLYYAHNLYWNNNVWVTGIAIPNGVTGIGNYAFCGWSSLTSITIPDSVTRIGNGAFDGCCSLTSITIPDSVTQMGAQVFYDCKITVSRKKSRAKGWDKDWNVVKEIGIFKKRCKVVYRK